MLTKWTMFLLCIKSQASSQVGVVLLSCVKAGYTKINKQTSIGGVFLSLSHADLGLTQQMFIIIL